MKQSQLGMALLVIILLAVTLFASACRGATSDVAEEESVGGSVIRTANEFDPAATGLDLYEGLPVGFTEEGHPFRGNPDAPITLIEYSDYLCPFCSRYFEQVETLLLASYGIHGDVKFVFRDYPLQAIHPTAAAGHLAAICAGDQGAPLFWELHDLLFTNQAQWSVLPDPGDYIAGLAESIGVDMARYSACMDDSQTLARLAGRISEGQAAGARGTPTFQVVLEETGAIHPLVGAQPVGAFSELFELLLTGANPDVVVASSAESSVDATTLNQISFDVDALDLETYKGLPVGFTEEGYPFIGNPEAELTVVEFSDYLCPFCGRHFTQTVPELLTSYGASGDVNFVFRDFPLISIHPTAPAGHIAALCVGEQGAALFWEMHDTLFATQQQWANLPDPAAFIRGLAEGIGTEMVLYDSCLEKGEAAVRVDEQVAAGRALGFSGTPMFQVLVNESGDLYPINGAQAMPIFSELLDTLLAGETPELAAEPEPDELPYWASVEGLAPDPDRPGYTLAGDPYKGNPEALVVVVEFADFQCPACGQHALEIQPALDEALVDTGEIMWVFKPLPLKEHPQALVAAVAAECAGEQGHFWEMYDLLFARQSEWAQAEAEAQLLELAQELALDMTDFSTCFNSRAALESVVADIYDAQGISETTPAFIVLQNGRGNLLTGSRTPADFENILRSRLDGATDQN